MKIDKQTKLWKYAAWTLPFLALAAIIFAYWIELSLLVKEKLGIEEKFHTLTEELKAIRKDLKR
jgi:sugar/nucleoside kinase (ribokinase family)